MACSGRKSPTFTEVYKLREDWELGFQECSNEPVDVAAGKAGETSVPSLAPLSCPFVNLLGPPASFASASPPQQFNAFQKDFETIARRMDCDGRE